MRFEPRAMAGRIPPVAIVFVTVIVLFTPALLPDRVLSPADAIFSLPLYRDLAPAGWDSPSNPLLFDQVYQFAPWRHFAWESLRAGDIPLWNPYSSTGTPFVATMQSAVFYPINLALTAVPFERTFVLSAILRLWIAGGATYLLARRYGLGRMPSAISAMSFTFCSFLVVWLGHPHTNVAVWLPALVLAAEHLVTARTWWQYAVAVGALAMVTGIQLTGGHVETSADIMFATGVYYLVRIIQQRFWRAVRRASAQVVTFAMGIILGAGIAAVQLLPFLEWLPLSAEYQLRSQEGFTAFDGVFLKNLLALPLALVPNLYNNPIWEQPYWSFNPWGNYNESALYAGVIPLLLAVIGALMSWRASAQARAWVIVGLLMLGMAFQLPLFDWLNQIPGRSLAHPNRLRLIVMFAIAMLAGYGTSAVLSTSRGKMLCWFKAGLVAVVTLYALLFIVGGILLPRYDKALEDRLQYEVEKRYENVATRPRSVSICIDRMEACVDDIERAFAPTRWTMYVPGVIAAALLVGLHIPWIRQFAPTLIPIAILGELLLTAWGFNPVVDTEHFFPEPNILNDIETRDGESRTTVIGQASYPDSHMMHGLSEVRGLDFPTAWYNDYLDATGDRIPWLANGVLLDSVESPLTHYLNIGYVIGTPDQLAASDLLNVVAMDDRVALAAAVDPAPRAFAVQQVVLTPDDEAAARLLQEAPATIGERVILPDSAEARSAQGRVNGQLAGSAGVTLLDYQAETSRWHVETDATVFVVVSDAYYPGWNATLDGEPAPLYRANIAFRAVEVPAGAHTLEFHYEPRSYRLGGIITLISLFVAVSLLIAPGLRPYARRLTRR